jgi:hypothetical protein
MYPFLLSFLLGENLELQQLRYGRAAVRTVHTAILDYESLEISCLPLNISVPKISSRDDFILEFKARHVEVRRRWFTHMLYSSAILNGWLTDICLLMAAAYFEANSTLSFC